MTKKRYTKKKKSVRDKDSNDIPYTKVRVEWVDGTITFGDRTMIPKSWIVKITEI